MTGDQAVGGPCGCGVGGCGFTSYRVVIVLGVAGRERLSVVQAYRFALDLTARQERAVLAHAGAARVAHNWALVSIPWKRGGLFKLPEPGGLRR
ncbi:helix-turn-helix domain-containing protein [Micromonospora sp. NBC_00898]|uniref:helix-turn-helix domain-containing protein n=1 Tax=Micromonospora sp. NBC_00898 TaxID=2975981 RepID=UPI00386E71E2